MGNGKPDSLTLSNANFAGVASHAITVDGGNAGNVLSEAGVSAADHAVLKGGAGADTLVAGPNALMTGGAGADLFEFMTPGTLAIPDHNIVADFAPAMDKVALSDAGFALGLGGAGATPKALPASLFTADKTGAFDSAIDRFAYNMSTGALFYDAHGNAGGSHQLVATFSGHPLLGAGNLFFVS